jgi:hypothetical protein
MLVINWPFLYIFFFQQSGSITYNGHRHDEFCVQRTSAYISQTDNHLAELTVRESLDFAARCQGASEGFSGLFSLIYYLQPVWFIIQPFININYVVMNILRVLIGYIEDLDRLEKERNIRPSPEIDAFMKVVILNLLL